MHISRGSTLAVGLATAVAALLMLTPGCSRAKQSASLEPPLALRSYQVAPEQGPELSSIINHVLSRGDDTPPAGRAQLGPNGLLVVAAPEKLLDQVNRLVAEVGKQAPQAPPMVTLTYWALVGHSAETTSKPERLDELEDVLDAIASADGPTEFRLLEKLRVSSLSGERVSVDGSQLRIRRQEASLQDGRVIADLDLQKLSGTGGLATRVSLPPSKILVLGEMGFSERIAQRPTGDSLYLIIRADVAPERESQR